MRGTKKGLRSLTRALSYGAVSQGPHRAGRPPQRRSGTTTVAAQQRAHEQQTQERGPQEGPDPWSRYGHGRFYGINPNPQPARLRNGSYQRQGRRGPGSRRGTGARPVSRQEVDSGGDRPIPGTPTKTIGRVRRTCGLQLADQPGTRRSTRRHDMTPNDLGRFSWPRRPFHWGPVRGDPMVRPDHRVQTG